MKYRFLLVMLFFMVANGYSQLTLQSSSSAIFSRSVRLNDGDSICVTPQYPSDNYCAREKEICNKYEGQIMSAGILKAFDIEKHEEELNELMECGVLGLYNGYPFYYRLYCLFSSDYFRNLIKVKVVRDYGFRVLSGLAFDLCSYFPKDFNTKLISELKDVQSTIKKCKKHRYECVKDNDGHLRLSVDGQINDDVASTMEGMIARRICMDKIPVSELEEFVSSLLSRLKSRNTENNPDYLYKVTINNEMSYCLGIDGPFFISEKSKKKTVPFENEYYLLSNYYAQKVYYNIGYDGKYYKIRNQYFYNGECKPLPRYYDDIQEIILNPEGKEIFRNRNVPTD